MLAKLLGLNLLGVFLAHGGEQVGKDHAALQKVEAVELLHLLHGENLPWKEQLLGGRGRKLALIRGVMNREHSGRAAQRGVRRIHRAEIHRNQRSLPIVHMEDLRHAEEFRGLDHRPAKQAEALGVVGIITARGSVKLFSVK